MFKLAALSTGSDPDDWDTLDTLLSLNNVPVEPEWTYQPYSEIAKTLAGSGYGRGFAIATWHLNIAHNTQRTILRTFCPGTSAEVYLSTPTNEDDTNGDPVFKDFRATMHWMAGQEDKQIRHTLGIDLTFTHLVEVV